MEVELDVQSIGAERLRHTFRPLDGQHRIGGEHILNADVSEVAGSQPIEVDVMEREPPLVLMNEGEAGTGGRLAHAQAFCQSLDEGGLASPQLSVETEQISGEQMRCEVPAEGASPGR
jgi:hypothetical protein